MPSVILDVANMIDLALGMPEMGVINFAMLHSLLHVLANEQKSLNQLVELQGVSVPSYLLKDGHMIQTVQCKECFVQFDADETSDGPEFAHCDQNVTSGGGRQRDATKNDRAKLIVDQDKQHISKQHDNQHITKQEDRRSSIEARKKNTGGNKVYSQSGRQSQRESKGLSERIDVGSDMKKLKKTIESLDSAKSKRNESNIESKNNDTGMGLESYRGQSSESNLNYQPHGKSSRKKQAEAEHTYLKTKQDVFVGELQSREQSDRKDQQKTRSPRKETGEPYEHDQSEDESVNDGSGISEIIHLEQTGANNSKTQLNVNPQSKLNNQEQNEGLNKIKNRKKKSREENDESSSLISSANVEKRDQLVDNKGNQAQLEKQTEKPGGGAGKATKTLKDEKLLIVQRVSKTSIDISKSLQSKRFPEDAMLKKSDRNRLSIVSIQKFDELKKTVEDMQDVMMGKLPTNAEVIGDSRPRDNKKTITDMWQSINVSSRLEAMEEGVNQLTKVMQTLIDDKGGDSKNIADDLSKLEAKLEIAMCTQAKGLANLKDILVKFETKCSCRTDDLELKSKVMANMMDELSTAQHALSKLEFQMNDQMQVYDDDIEELKEAIFRITEEKVVNVDVNSIVKDIKNLNEKNSDLNERFDELHQNAVTMDCTFEEKHTQLSNMMQDEIEYLKCVKIDRYELEDLVRDKADVSAINRLVSVDEYEAYSCNMHNRLATVEKDFEQQEEVWITKFNLIAQETDRKIDKTDVYALKDFTNNTFVHFYNKVNDLKKIIDQNIVKSAATVKKMLRDVQCITCDSTVMMMRTEANPIIPHQDPMISNAPAIRLELDKVHSGERYLENQPTRQHENYATINVPHGSDSNHLCNRYCGGSHTLLTPKLRKAAIATANQVSEKAILSCACNCKNDDEQRAGNSLDDCTCEDYD